MFSKIVCNILPSWCPVDPKLALVDSIADPIETHVYRFRSDLFDGPIHNATCSSVVSFDWCCWLWVAHLCECLTQDGALFGVEEEGANFSFGGGGHDAAEYFRKAEDGSVKDRWFPRQVSKIVMTTGTAAGFRFGEVGSIAVDVEDHVAGIVAELGVWVRGTVV